MSSAQSHEDVNRLKQPAQLSRRALLRGAGGVGLASVVPALAAAARPSDSSAAPGTTAAPARAPHQDTVELKFNARSGAEQQIFEGFIAQFTEQNPSIKITGQYFAGANQEYFQKVAVLIAGGTQGDLIWMSSIEGYYDYASAGPGSRSMTTSRRTRSTARSGIPRRSACSRSATPPTRCRSGRTRPSSGSTTTRICSTRTASRSRTAPGRPKRWPRRPPN